MKCPNCGREIKDDALFCEYCFTEIRMVPTYEPSVEQKMHEAMKDIGKDIHRQERSEKKRAERALEVSRAKKKLALILIGAAAALLLAGVLFGIYRYNLLHSESYYVGTAYTAATQGDYEGAAGEIQKALDLNETGTPNDTLLLKKEEYLQKAGNMDGALEIALEVAKDPNADPDTVMEAYTRAISIYSARADYASISSLLDGCGNHAVQEKYLEYMIFEPTLTPDGGTYNDGSLSVEMHTEGNGSIFYTTDGTDPTTQSSLYTKPLELGTGTWTVKAVCVNHLGEMSHVVTSHYTVVEN